eukprot:scaffold21463_cov52-Attheya_sp.AAC.5
MVNKYVEPGDEGYSFDWLYRNTLERPSGIALPLVLRERASRQDVPASEISGPQPDATIEINNVMPVEESKNETVVKKAEQMVDLSEKVPLGVRKRVWTTQELQERVAKAEAAMVQIQRQLHCGEECYFEETNHHGNIFRGWDAFVDSKDDPAANNGPSRRIHSDHRWFYTSCKTYTRSGLSPLPPHSTSISPLPRRPISVTQQHQQQQQITSASSAPQSEAAESQASSTVVSTTSTPTNIVEGKAEPSHESKDIPTPVKTEVNEPAKAREEENNETMEPPFKKKKT